MHDYDLDAWGELAVEVGFSDKSEDGEQIGYRDKDFGGRDSFLDNAIMREDARQGSDCAG